MKPKHVAPIFHMKPSELTDVLRNLHLVYPLEQTPLGSFLIRNEDLKVIEHYIRTNQFFRNKKTALSHFKEYADTHFPQEKNDWGIYILHVRKK